MKNSDISEPLSNRGLANIFFVILFFSLSTLPVKGQETVLINEFVASNSSTLADIDSEFSDWIEIYNPTSETIELTGWTLTDDPDETQQWTFPQTTLNTDSYLIVFASGKDYSDPTGELHTNFKIDNEGEFLALYDENEVPITVFESFPALSTDQSYNYFQNQYIISSTPTPGEINHISGTENLVAPSFNKPHGFYDESFDLEITTSLSGSDIYYTTDGSEPTVGNGSLYSAPININGTSVIRASVFKNGFKSRIATSTFLFVEDIIEQPDDPEGYPETWGEFYESEGIATADYGMDFELTRNMDYKDLLDDALLSLPVLSVVTNKNHLFSHSTNPDSGGIYIYTGNYGNDPGKGWERPASIEIFNDEKLDFQEDVGIELHGGASRLADKTPKHSFRLSFKDEYGPTKLEYPIFGTKSGNSFNSLVLRASYGNTWLHRSANERRHATLLHDLWGKDTQLDMGHPAGYGRFFHLYLNGMYWGIYNPTERLNKEFAARNFEGQEEDFDIIKDYGEVVEGNRISWGELFALSRKDLSDDANYFRIMGKNPDGTNNPSFPSYLDVVNFIDYMLINLYGANWDWDGHNWAAIRNRVNPDKGFKFFSWDAEHILEEIDDNILEINNEGRPSELFQNMRQNEHFLQLFADRVQEHFFNDGALTSEAGIKRLMKRASEIELAIIAESQRWGDYRRDVHRSYNSGPFDLYTKKHWLEEIDFLTIEYFPRRGNVFLDQLKEAGLFPGFNAPEFEINQEANIDTISMGDILTMSSPVGTIYYTLNGNDPLQNGALSDEALEYSDPITLNVSVKVKARLFHQNEWSALNEQFYFLPEKFEPLKVTEIHYHPLPDEDVEDGNFEFIELKNTSESKLDLSGIQFTEGITYIFPEIGIQPGEFIVLASNAMDFEDRYGFEAFGEFEGSIDNSGERILLSDTDGDTLINIRYNDKFPWPENTDGDGYSLVPKKENAPGNQNDPEKWRRSTEIHGSPGKDDPEPTPTSVNVPTTSLTFSLQQNFPNPFNPTTNIGYELKENQRVTLKVYDMLGREVAVLVDDKMLRGNHQVSFDASTLSTGIYFYTLQTHSNSSTKKMLLIK